VPLAVGTNAEPANADFSLDSGGLRRFFRVVVDGAQVSRPKPHPEIYLRTAELLGLPPANCIVFEDSRTGVEAARAAGARVVGLTTTHDQLPEVDLRIQDFLDPTLDLWLSCQRRWLRPLGRRVGNCRAAPVRHGGSPRCPPTGERDGAPRFRLRGGAGGLGGPRLGTVSSRPVSFASFSHLAIQDETGHGLFLEGQPAQFARLQPGDRVEVSGNGFQAGRPPGAAPSQHPAGIEGRCTGAAAGLDSGPAEFRAPGDARSRSSAMSPTRARTATASTC